MRTPLAAASLAAALAVGSMLAASPVARPVAAGDTIPPKDDRMAWWRNARFGMFIHWGLYAIPAGEWHGKKDKGAGEWILNGLQIDPVEYEKELLPKFNPTKFDPKEWARMAKEAGMGYVVITTKHHDGFALWDSKVSDYTVMHTPFKRDIMKELSEAVRGEGLQMCWYHSIMDWHHPDYLPHRAWDKRPTDPNSFPRYVDYMDAQLRELLTNYGKIGILWFDGEWESTWNHDWGKRTDDLVRSLQPSIIVNNRVDSGRAGMAGFSKDELARGDYGTPEQTIPPNGMPGKDWETCMTMNDTWGYKVADINWKTSQVLIRMLCDIASKGGNFLLNVGPMPDGSFPPESVERLHNIGLWMKTNHEAIVGTTASPFPRKFDWGCVTQKPGPTISGRETTYLYLMVFQWPKGNEMRIPGINNDPLSAQVLGATMHCTTVRSGESIVIKGMHGDSDENATVIRLQVVGKPDVEPFYILPAADGSISLDAADATTTGSIQYEERFRNLGWWNDLGSVASWSVKARLPGEYDAAIEYSADKGCGGELAWEVLREGGRNNAGGASLPARSGWGDFGTIPIGRVHIPAGPSEFRLRAKAKSGDSFANVRRIVLTPAK